MNDLIISVVMSVYNGEITWLMPSSILHQTFQDFEFIIINDGSTDTSWRIIQQYASKTKLFLSPGKYRVNAITE